MGIFTPAASPQPEQPEPPKFYEDRELTEVEEIFVWRLHTLMDAGYPLRYAEKIALRSEISLRDAERLMNEGCPPETAAKILL